MGNRPVHPSSGSPQTPDDEKILKHASELFRQLGITKREPDSVVWVRSMYPDIVIVRLGKVRLPRKMMGKLTPEDWKPLLAPAIVYNYVLSRDRNRGPLLRAVLPLGLAEIPLVYALLQIFRLSRQTDTTGLLLATIILWIIYASSILALYIRWYWRSLSYSANRRAADVVGREVLLAALAKYGQAISATGYPLKRLHLWPTVNQRIQRLQKDLR
jgi:uncharacterized membrane protein (GlpM family)